MKVVIPGGSGSLGQAIARSLTASGHEVVILSRGGRAASGRPVHWDACTLGDWAQELDGADAVIVLAGKSVNCQHTPAAREEMRRSRLESVAVVGKAMAACNRPPHTWLQASSATVYSHRYDAPNDEEHGRIIARSPDTPEHWRHSVELVQDWERAAQTACPAETRLSLLRIAMVMALGPDETFNLLYTLARRGLGGPIAGGRQMMSWIHEVDLVRAVEFVLDHRELKGPVNIASPHPLSQREFMRVLRQSAGIPIGLPATAWMLELGTRVLKTESELILKSRFVVPGRLSAAGFEFEFARWADAAHDLCARWRKQ